MSRKTIDGLGSFKVGTHEYRFELLPPLEVIAFGNRVIRTAGGAIAGLLLNRSELTAENITKVLSGIDAGDLSALMKEALARCYTPTNLSLADDANFNSWFSEHPEEMFQAGIQAVYNQVKDFFPNLPGTPTNS